MSEAYLQILLILAFLAIGLISVTFPIYAICVTYLRRETHETERERRQRIEILKHSVADLIRKSQRENPSLAIMTQLRNHQAELRALKLRVGYLTAKGAVAIPVVFLFLALLTAIFGIQVLYSTYEQWSLILGLVSGVFSVAGVLRLYKTISAIEHAALRAARTIEFKVGYGIGKESKEMKLKKPTPLDISAGTMDEDLEHFEINVFFPPEISIVEMKTADAYASIQPKSADHPKYVMVTREKNFVTKNTAVGFSVVVSANKIGKFLIPVEVSAKGIYAYRTNLTLDVVK